MNKKASAQHVEVVTSFYEDVFKHPSDHVIFHEYRKGNSNVNHVYVFSDKKEEKEEIAGAISFVQGDSTIGSPCVLVTYTCTKVEYRGAGLCTLLMQIAQEFSTNFPFTLNQKVKYQFRVGAHQQRPDSPTKIYLQCRHTLVSFYSTSMYFDIVPSHVIDNLFPDHCCAGLVSMVCRHAIQRSCPAVLDGTEYTLEAACILLFDNIFIDDHWEDDSESQIVKPM